MFPFDFFMRRISLCAPNSRGVGAESAGGKVGAESAGGKEKEAGIVGVDEEGEARCRRAAAERRRKGCWSRGQPADGGEHEHDDGGGRWR